MKRRTIMTVFVSILTAAVLAGCGSSSSSAAKEASAPMYNDYEDAEAMAYAEEAMTDDVYEYEDYDEFRDEYDEYAGDFDDDDEDYTEDLDELNNYGFDDDEY